MTLNILEQLSGYIAWKDINHNYLGCNRNLAKIYGFNHPEQIIGMRDEDLCLTSEEALAFYQDYDKLALAGQTANVIHNIGSHNKNKSFLLEKKPLYDDKNHVTGIIFQCCELKENIIHHLNKNNLKSSKAYNIGTFENIFGLSTRELECLFCVIHGLTAKRIAEVLQLSKRTIEFYISNIKNKFGSSNKSELMVLAMQHGYMDTIPPRFINVNLQELFP